MADEGVLTVSEISDPEELAAWTNAMYVTFQNSENVLAETLFGLPRHAMPSEAQLNAAVKSHIEAIESNPGSDGGHNSHVQVIDQSTGGFMGGAKWVFYAEKPKRPEKVDVSWLSGDGPEAAFEKEFAQAAMDELHSRRYRFMDMPHALLNICFTAPKYERRGVASAMTKWGLDKADALQVPAFVEASPLGAPVYARAGFETREKVGLRWDERGREWMKKGTVQWTFMDRQPAQPSRE